MKWKDKLIEDIQEILKDNDYWSALLLRETNHATVNIHLAVFNEPFLQLLLQKKKTIESRFSINNVVPYNRVKSGDIVLVKRSGGPVEAIFMASEIKYYRNLTSEKLKQLENEVGKNIGWDIDPEFLANKKHARYLTLIYISNLTTVPPVLSEKKDKNGWSIIKLGHNSTLFEL